MSHIAVVGAAFNPPSLGHQDVIEQCLETFDEVWLVPSYQHAFGKTMIDYAIRVKMLTCFIDDLALDRVTLKAVEHFIAKANEPVYSIDLMNYLQQGLDKNTHLSLVIGPDNDKAFHKFKSADKLRQTFSPFVVKERKNIRSTDIRNALKDGRDFKNLTTRSVYDYLKQHDPYHVNKQNDQQQVSEP